MEDSESFELVTYHLRVDKTIRPIHCLTFFNRVEFLAESLTPIVGIEGINKLNGVQNVVTLKKQSLDGEIEDIPMITLSRNGTYQLLLEASKIDPIKPGVTELLNWLYTSSSFGVIMPYELNEFWVMQQPQEITDINEFLKPPPIIRISDKYKEYFINRRLYCRTTLWYFDADKNVSLMADNLLEGVLTVNVESNGEAEFSSLKITGGSNGEMLSGIFCLQFQLLEKTETSEINHLDGEPFLKAFARTLDIRLSKKKASNEISSKRKRKEDEQTLDDDSTSTSISPNKKIKNEKSQEETSWNNSVNLFNSSPRPVPFQLVGNHEQEMVRLTSGLMHNSSPPLPQDPIKSAITNENLNVTDFQNDLLPHPSSIHKQSQASDTDEEDEIGNREHHHKHTNFEHWINETVKYDRSNVELTPQQQRLQTSNFISKIQELMVHQRNGSDNLVMPVSPPPLNMLGKIPAPKKNSSGAAAGKDIADGCAGSIGFDDPNGIKVEITHLLTLPQSEAAQQLDMSNATFSKRFRQANNNKRWPFRALQVVDKQLKEARAKQSLSSIQLLEEKRRSLLEPAYILLKK